jgi:hypothetical protein
MNQYYCQNCRKTVLPDQLVPDEVDLKSIEESRCPDHAPTYSHKECGSPVSKLASRMPDTEL